MHHTRKRFGRKEACISDIYAKRHTDLIPMPACTVRRTCVHRTSYACTPNAVRMYTVRRTWSSEREAATKHAAREDAEHLKDLLPGRGG